MEQFKMNDNENTTCHHLWDTAYTPDREKCIALNAQVSESLNINNQHFHLKMIIKEEQNKIKVSMRKNIFKKHKKSSSKEKSNRKQ